MAIPVLSPPFPCLGCGYHKSLSRVSLPQVRLSQFSLHCFIASGMAIPILSPPFPCLGCGYPNSLSRVSLPQIWLSQFSLHYFLAQVWLSQFSPLFHCLRYGYSSHLSSSSVTSFPVTWLWSVTFLTCCRIPVLYLCSA